MLLSTSVWVLVLAGGFADVIQSQSDATLSGAASVSGHHEGIIWQLLHESFRQELCANTLRPYIYRYSLCQANIASWHSTILETNSSEPSPIINYTSNCNTNYCSRLGVLDRARNGHWTYRLTPSAGQRAGRRRPHVEIERRQRHQQVLVNNHPGRVRMARRWAEEVSILATLLDQTLEQR